MNPRRPFHRGYTLIEILFTLVLLGILLALATPRLSAWIARARMTAVLNQLVGDIQYGRMLAVRAGRRTTVQFTRDAARCVTRYDIVVQSAPAPRQAKTVDVQSDAHGLCLSVNGSPTLTFDSRGLPAPVQNRSFWIRHGSMRDSVTMSSMGRLYRLD